MACYPYSSNFSCLTPMTLTLPFTFLGSRLARAAVLTATLGLAAVSQATPIDGAPIIVSSTGDVIARFDGHSQSTAYTSDLYLVLNNQFLFNNFGSLVGSTVDLGSFTAGTELVFSLYVYNTGNTFYSGANSRNPDGMAHARVFDEDNSGWTAVHWEDLFGDPEGSAGFNDLYFSFTNVSAGGVPDVSSTSALLALGLAALAGIARRRRQA
jgi:hypothetical protein